VAVILREQGRIRDLLTGRSWRNADPGYAWIELTADGEFDDKGRIVVPVTVYDENKVPVFDHHLRVYSDGLGDLEPVVMDGRIQQGLLYRIGVKVSKTKGVKSRIIVYARHDRNQGNLTNVPPPQPEAGGPPGSPVSQVPSCDGNASPNQTSETGPSKPAASDHAGQTGPATAGSGRGQPGAGGAAVTNPSALVRSDSGSDRPVASSQQRDTPPPAEPPACPKCGKPATDFQGQWVHCGERVG